MPFFLQCRLLILGSSRKQSLRRKFMSCGLMQEGSSGGAKDREQDGAGEPSGVGWGDSEEKLVCIFVLFSRYTHLPGFQAPVILWWLVLLPRPWSQRPPIPCLLLVRIHLTRHKQPLISPESGHLPSQAACRESLAAVTYSNSQEVMRVLHWGLLWVQLCSLCMLKS